MGGNRTRRPQEATVPSWFGGYRRTITSEHVVHRADDLTGERYRVASVCPVCGRADQIRKVSSIVDDGTAVTHTSGSSIGVAVAPELIPVVMGNSSVSSSQTTLASWLTFPTVRQPRTMGLGVGFLIASALGHLVLFALMILVAQGDDEVIPWTVPTLGPLCLTGPFWVLGVVLTSSGYRHRLRYRAAEPSRRHMWELWDACYYCYRDDVVYLPDGLWCHPVQMRKFLVDTSDKPDVTWQ